MTKPTTVEGYLAGLSEPARAGMLQLRAAISESAPHANETIAYDMPAFREHGKFLVSYGAFRRHWSLFPASGVVRDALGAELEPFFAGKGTIKFPSGKPIPLELVRKVVRLRVRELAAARGEGSG